jgi:hypothetical protein
MNEIAENNPSDNVMTFQFSRCIVLPPLGLL